MDQKAIVIYSDSLLVIPIHIAINKTNHIPCEFLLIQEENWLTFAIALYNVDECLAFCCKMHPYAACWMSSVGHHLDGSSSYNILPICKIYTPICGVPNLEILNLNSIFLHDKLISWIWDSKLFICYFSSLVVLDVLLYFFTCRSFIACIP